MSGPFDSGYFPDGSPRPYVSMRNVHAAQQRLAIANEDAARMASVYAEQARLAEAAKRYEDIQRSEAEMAYLRQQQREASRAAGDDSADRLRAAYLAEVRKQAEAAGLDFVEPVEPEPVELPERSMTQETGPSYDGAALTNLRERAVRNMIADAERLGIPVPDEARALAG